MYEPVYKMNVFFSLIFSTHLLGNSCTSDSEASCLIKILKIVMRRTAREIFVIKHIYILSVDLCFVGLYLCNLQNQYNPRLNLHVTFLSTIFYQQYNYDASGKIDSKLYSGSCRNHYNCKLIISLT